MTGGSSALWRKHSRGTPGNTRWKNVHFSHIQWTYIYLLIGFYFSHQTNPTTSNSTPPPGDPPSLSQSPTSSLPELPPIDYEDRAGNPLPKPSQLNSIDHRKSGLITAEVFFFFSLLPSGPFHFLCLLCT